MEFSHKKMALFIISTVKLRNFLLLIKVGLGWQLIPWYQVEAACRLLCYNKLAEFILHPRLLCAQHCLKARLGLQDSIAQHSMGLDCSG